MSPHGYEQTWEGLSRNVRFPPESGYRRPRDAAAARRRRADPLRVHLLRHHRVAVRRSRVDQRDRARHRRRRPHRPLGRHRRHDRHGEVSPGRAARLHGLHDGRQRVHHAAADLTARVDARLPLESGHTTKKRPRSAFGPKETFGAFRQRRLAYAVVGGGATRDLERQTNLDGKFATMRA